MNPKVFIGIPTYSGEMRAHIHYALNNASKKGIDTVVKIVNSSFLTRCFNELWCQALNMRKEGVTHFAMVHADIVPENNWLDLLMREMREYNADMVSAIVPIKSQRGDTSTAYDFGGFNTVRLNYRDVNKQLPTFTNENILLNSGLMLIDLSGEWVEKIHFRVENAIVFEEGVFQPRSVSEDWLFSRDAKALGAKIYATRNVHMQHWGSAGFVPDLGR